MVEGDVIAIAMNAKAARIVFFFSLIGLFMTGPPRLQGFSLIRLLPSARNMPEMPIERKTLIYKENLCYWLEKTNSNE